MSFFSPFSPFSPFFQGIRKVYQFIGISLVWMLCCVPIVTAGAATTALYDTVTRVIRESRGYLLRTFLASFRRNFGQVTGMWLLFLAVGAAMSFNIQIIRLTDKVWLKPLLLPAIGLCAWLAVTAVYYVTLIAKFNNTCAGTLKNALVMAILHLPTTFLLAAGTALAAALAYVWLPFFWIMPASVALFWSVCLERIYRKYEEVTEYESQLCKG